MMSSANSPLEDFDGLRTHAFESGLIQVIFAELIRGSPIYLGQKIERFLRRIYVMTDE